MGIKKIKKIRAMERKDTKEATLLPNTNMR